MDRCALFVDAGYVLTDGAMAVHGTRRRESVSWDYAGLLQLFGNLATERTRLPLLRCYWYEATVEGRWSADHDTLADLPGVKLRVAKMRPGRREGVEGEIHRDLTTLARNKAVNDVMVVSAEEDLAQVIADVQDMGMRVTLLHIATDGNRTLSRTLRQECDDIVEISAAHLRPYVELISGAEPPRQDESEGAATALHPAMNGSPKGNNVNGNNVNGNNVNGNNAGPGAGRAAAYAQHQQHQHQQQQGRPGAGQQPPANSPFQPVAVPSAPDRPGRQGPQPVAMEAVPGDPGQPEGPDGIPAADYATATDLGTTVDYSASVDYGAAADHAPAAAEHAPTDQAAVDYGSALDYGPMVEYSAVPDYADPAPVPMPAPVPVPPREEIYGAPVALPASAEDLPGARPRPVADPSAYNPGAVREQYQRDGMMREVPAGDSGDRLQPVPAALPVGNSAQIRRLPTRGAVPGGPNPGQPPLSLPPAQADGTIGQQSGGQQPGGQPAVPVAPVVPMDSNGMSYAGARGASLGGPRHVLPGPGAPGGPVGPVGLAAPGGGPAGNQGSGPHPVLGPVAVGPPSASQQGPPLPQGPQGPPVPQVPQGPPTQGGQPGGYSGGVPGISLADAVQSAHEEGQAFGESVARDAPALWLEAVLARKPRMPSDLEARLLQGSALPIDFLLHDEVRHALRRGFWDALERARR